MKEIRRCLRTVSWSDSGLPRVCTIFEGTSELLDVADRFTGGSRRYDVQSHVLLLDHYLGAVAARVFPFALEAQDREPQAGTGKSAKNPQRGEIRLLKPTETFGGAQSTSKKQIMRLFETRLTCCYYVTILRFYDAREPKHVLGIEIVAAKSISAGLQQHGEHRHSGARKLWAQADHRCL